jgi:cytochrome b561
MLKNTAHSYGKLARAFHWLGALGVIVALVLIELRGFTPKGTAIHDAMRYGHIQAGLIVLLLLLPRLLWRVSNREPVITPAPKPSAMLLAHLAHWALYALMLAIPLLGVAMVQGAGKDVVFLGNTLPVFFTISKDLAHQLKELHELLGNVIMWLAGLHIAAAIWHHRAAGDDTLSRMTGPIRGD